MDLLFCPGMGSGMDAGNDVGMGTGARVAAADRLIARPRASRARFEEERAISGRLVIVASLFLAFMAAALLAGGRAAIDPLLKSAMAARAARGAGDVVYTMPDGIFCRHMSFENTTAEVAEGAVERCRTDIARDRGRAVRGFAWGAN
jgi:hypothetical protein